MIGRYVETREDLHGSGPMDVDKPELEPDAEYQDGKDVNVFYGAGPASRGTVMGNFGEGGNNKGTDGEGQWQPQTGRKGFF